MFEENMSRESLIKLLEKIKEETGLDLLDKIDSIVVINAEKSSDLDASKISYSRKDLDGWNFHIEQGLYSYIFVSKKSDLKSFTLIYDSSANILGCKLQSENLKAAIITIELPSNPSREDVLSMVAVLAKHIELLSEVYDYEVPSTDVCAEFSDQILNILEKQSE